MGKDRKTFSGMSGTTGLRKGRFIDKDTVEWTLVAKNKDGKVFLDLQAKQTRRKPPIDKPKPEKVEAKSPELKVLERLIGSWDTTAVSKPAVWTPQEVRTTSKVERKWVLSGRFLEDRSKASDDSPGSSLSLMTYDPQMKAYRGWWFSSEGHTDQLTGQWDEKTETMSFTSHPGNGLVARSSVRFIDRDRHEWKVAVKDGDGKLYFDTT